MKLKPINQQVVVLFGASSGIGREAALQFAQKGAKVVVAARDEAGLQSLVDEIQSLGGQARYKVADTSEFDQVQAVADQAVEWYGRLDTWIHLAAVAVYATFEETSPEEFKHVIDVNLTGQAYGAKAALPYLRQSGGGALIHISSVEAKRALPYHSAYAASKHGIVGFLDALRLELAHEGVPISVTNVMPASINTPFFSKARTKLGVQPKGIPPIYQPHIVAEVILYAAENPVRDIFVGGAGKVMATLHTLSPRLADAVFMQIGFEGQKTNWPKPADAPDNFFEPLPGYDRVEGDFSAEARSTSLYTKLQMWPALNTFITSLAVGAAAAMASRAFRGNGSAGALPGESRRRVASPEFTGGF